MKYFLIEGVEFDPSKNSFLFDFLVDSEKSIVRLNEQLFQIKEYQPCTYFSYTFDDSVDKKTKSLFIDAIKYPNNSEHAKISKNELNRFLNNAISKLNDKINLAQYDVVIYPESSSKLNKIVFEKIIDVAMPKHYLSFELVKDLPKNITIDKDRYFNVRHTAEKDKPSVMKTMDSIEKMIHQLDYLKLGKNIPPKYRKYLKNFFHFKNEEDKKTFLSLNEEKKILVIDDVATTGSTIKYLLNAIRTVNAVKDSRISIFCILGNKITV